MTYPRFDRRDFNKLTSAALGGLAAGSLLGCGKSGGGPVGVPGGGPVDMAKAEIHLCRGLNECKGQGKGSENACRGQGTCATAKEHSCGGQNECKNLGGCGETAGANECKTHGGCHVPLMDSAWETLRKRKEGEWAEKKLAVGTAPPKSEKKE